MPASCCEEGSLDEYKSMWAIGSAVEQIHGVVRISQFFFSPALFICPPVAHPPQPAHSQCHLGSIIVFQAEEERRLLKEESKSFQSSHRKKGQGNELEPQRQGAHAGSQGILLGTRSLGLHNCAALLPPRNESQKSPHLLSCDPLLDIAHLPPPVCLWFCCSPTRKFFTRPDAMSSPDGIPYSLSPIPASSQSLESIFSSIDSN